MVKVTFVVIDHEIVPMVITSTVPLFWYSQFIHLSTGKLLTALAQDRSVAELCSSEFKVAQAMIRKVDYKHLPPY
jgi:hypothetical protein